MKTIYFVRHGQSVCNQREVVQDEDSDLTEIGESQSELVGDRFEKNYPVDIILSSNLIRADRTARIINKKLHKEIVYSNLLIERKAPTSLMGKPRSEITDIFNVIHDNYSFYPNWKYEDAESGFEISERAEQSLKFITSRPENRILVVTHGFFLRFIFSNIFGLNKHIGHLQRNFFWCIQFKNTGISTVTFDESKINTFKTAWCVDSINDYSHLKLN